jgi:Rad3-related DNA helicase
MISYDIINPMIDKSKFPFPTMRDVQSWFINEINKYPDKKYYVCEISTGGGKSPLAVAACQSTEKAYILCTTKLLQDQYTHDFSHLSYDSIKGKGNYQCNVNLKVNCDIGPCLGDKKRKIDCLKLKKCKYYNLKEKILKDNIFMTSYAFLFRCSDCGGWLDHRNLAIFDEAHTLEEQLVGFAESVIDINKLIKDWYTPSTITPDIQELIDEIPNEKYSEEDTATWLISVYHYVIKPKHEEEKKNLAFYSKTLDPTDRTAVNSLLKEYNKFKRLDFLERKLAGFCDEAGKDWVYEYKNSTVHITPLDISWVFAKFVAPYADKFIFMSATILDADTFIKTIGLPANETVFIRAESTFDPKKSPIYSLAMCDTNYQALQQKSNLDQIVKAINIILKQHPDEKGLIHAGNFTIIEYIKNHIKDPRLLIRYEDDTNDVILNRHIMDKGPTVLVSSSMEEGVSLDDDLSRWQIIVKMPFLSLGDKRINKLSKIGDWYQVMCARALVQMAGRSTRSEDDYCKTYILDKKFNYWIGQWKNKGWLPQQFLQRIKQLA